MKLYVEAGTKIEIALEIEPGIETEQEDSRQGEAALKLIYTIWLGSALLAAVTLIANSSTGSSLLPGPERHEIESARRPHYDIMGTRKRILYAYTGSDVIAPSVGARHEVT